MGFCENDKYCQKVLQKNFPGIPVFNDIKELDGTQFKTIDLVTGGFPCQPFSIAGKRRGKEDDRAIWPEMFRIIKETKPRWVVGENVTGIINMELDQVLSDLESESYETQTFIIPACGVGAPHRRKRVWIVAQSQHPDTNSIGLHRQKIKQQRETKFPDKQISGTKRFCENVADTTIGGTNVSNANKFNGDKSRFRASEISQLKASGISKLQNWLPEPNVGRVANGIPNRVDRLKALGNAIVPQVAMEIFAAMKEVDNLMKE